MKRWTGLAMMCALLAGCPDDAASPGTSGGQDAAAGDTGGDAGPGGDVASVDASDAASGDAGLDVALTDAGGDAGVTDAGPVDAGPGDVAAVDAGPDAGADPCGPGGFCRPLEASSCGDGAFGARPDLPCTLGAGSDGYCCVPLGECVTDADCPDCQLCDEPAVGPRTCVDPLATGTGCTGTGACPEGQCCSYAALSSKPLCGGLCVAEGGPEPCGVCVGEGGPTNEGSAVSCCPGLEPLDTAMALPDGLCLPSRCLNCQVCVQGCGDGKCTTGEDPCSCPVDCPELLPGGPGAACETGDDCTATGACLPEASGYPTGGYCTGGACNPGDLEAKCPAGSLCVGTVFAAAYLCMPSCNLDSDCRPGLTCEAFPEQAPGNGEYLCWESDLGKPNPQSGHGLSETCAKDADCISNLCMTHPTSGQKVCSAFCNDEKPCKAGHSCSPMGGCGFPGCGACFIL